MKAFAGYLEYAAYNRLVAARMPFCIATGLRAYVKIGAAAARAFTGDEAKLAALAPSTVAEKAKLSGLAGRPEQPLLRFGGLRNSYKPAARGYLAGFGSGEMTALWHHIGNGHYPPRPVLPLAVNETREIGFTIMRAAVGVGLGSRTALIGLPADAKTALAKRLRP